MALSTGELLAIHDRLLREHTAARPRFGTVIERTGPLAITHHGTHCTVEHPALDAETATSAAQLAEQVQARAVERTEPVEWQVFAHDPTAPRLTAALEAAGFTPGWERSVLVGEIAELDFPEPHSASHPASDSVSHSASQSASGSAPEWKVASVRWDEPEARRALELAAGSGPHRIPLAARHATRSIPYWDLDIRVLAHGGSVVAAGWVENVRDTVFAVIGGLTAPRLELLARLPLWRFHAPAKQFLVAEAADGQVRDALLAAGFHDVTTVRSHHWAPPGEPAATPPARSSLFGGENDRIAERCEGRIEFDYASGSGRYTAPVDSRSWFYGMLDMREDPAIAAAERVIERGLRACVPPGEWVYECRPCLNGWEFDPHRVGGPGQPPWPGNAVATREFQFLTTADARLGTFGHYHEQTLVVFGAKLVEQVAGELDRLFGGGAWSFE